MSSSEMQYLEKNTLSARDFTLAANNRCAGHPDGNSKGLEGTLSLVVVIVTSDNVDVHGDTRALGETLQTVRQHLCAQVANFLTAELQVADTEGAVGEVDDGTGEGFVERCVCISETGEAGG